MRRPLVEAVFGKLAEIAGELDRAAEAGEALRSPVAGKGERSEEALAALLGRLAGARSGRTAWPPRPQGSPRFRCRTTSVTC